MNMIVRCTAAAALLCGVVLQAPAGDASGASTPAGPTAIDQPKPVVIARVGGDDEITVEEFARFVSRDGSLLVAARDPQKKLGIVREMITQRLFARAAVDEGLVETEKGVPATREALIKGQAKLKARHFPLPPPPPEKQLAEYYEKHKEEFGIPRTRRVTQIQFRYAEGATDAQKAAAHAKAEAAWKRLEAGEALESVAAGTENVQARPRKGDLGFLPVGTHPWLDKALASIGKGQHTGVLESPVGYEILAVTDEREPMIVPFSKVRKPAEEQLREEGQRQLRSRYAHQLAGKYGVEIVLKEFEGSAP